MIYRQYYFRLLLKDTETKIRANVFHKNLLNFYMIKRHEMLKDLLEAQLKEFDIG